MNALGTGPSLQRLGRYHLSDCLGGGPTGEVFRAKVYGVAGMDREFAVKRFHSSLVADPKASAALAVAARMYGALEHPRVARLHEFGEAGGHTFTATELVPGLDLAQLIDQGKLSLGTASRLIVQVGRAVGYAHGRGLCHLGIAPTNVVCSELGEIKVTDFGVLPPRLSEKPAEDESLSHRLSYLAPEQLEGLRTSPATDVYQLGTLAHELMVGRRPFTARDGGQLAQQILGGAVPDTGLPKPYDKLLKRALARSPFERFPDAGAMADALEAALRSSPTPGSAADAGAAVAARMKMLQERRDGQASGVLSFPVPAPPRAPQVAPVPVAPPVPPAIPGTANTIPRVPAPAPSIPDIPARPPSAAETVPYVEDESSASADFNHEAPTLSGSAAEQAPTKVRPDLLEADLEMSADMELGPAGTDPSVARQDLLGGVDSAYVREDEAPTKVRGGPRADTEIETTVQDEETLGEDIFALVEDDVGKPAARRLESTLGELAPDEPAASAAPVEVRVATSPRIPPVPTGPDFSKVPPLMPDSDGEHSELILLPDDGPESVPIPPLPTQDSGIGSRAHRLPAELLPPQPNAANTRKVLPIALGAAVLAVGGFFGYQYLDSQRDDGAATAKVVASDGGVVIPSLAPKAAVADAAAVAARAHDAATTTLVVGDAGAVATANTTDAAVVAEPVVAAEPSATGRLVIATEPSGAKVYLDGTMVGTTPVDLDASTDRHRLALLLAGHDLYTSDIKGTGQLNIKLAEVTPPGGPAGIKVRCRNKNRYYVFVDSDPVGQLCPSERIGVSKGLHVVEIYDPLTDSRKAFNVNVADTRLSVRVKVD